MLLGAMWFAKEKPPMSIFLRPLLDTLNHMYKEGRHMKLYIVYKVLLVYTVYVLCDA